jgi:hypothetical protein
VNLHLSEIERELRESGRDPDNARAEARRRFGDPGVYRRVCRDVALKERIMLQRINLALLVVVMIALGATAWQSWSSQRRTAEAVERLSERIGALGATSGVAREPAEQRSTAMAALPEGAAFVGGSVARPGAYAIPHDGLSVRRLLVMAGAPERDFDVRIEPSSPVIGKEPRTMTAQELTEGRDHFVNRGDLVTVTQGRAQTREDRPRLHLSRPGPTRTVD